MYNLWYLWYPRCWFAFIQVYGLGFDSSNDSILQKTHSIWVFHEVRTGAQHSGSRGWCRSASAQRHKNETEGFFQNWLLYAFPASQRLLGFWIWICMTGTFVPQIPWPRFAQLKMSMLARLAKAATSSQNGIPLQRIRGPSKDVPERCKDVRMRIRAVTSELGKACVACASFVIVAPFFSTFRTAQAQLEPSVMRVRGPSLPAIIVERRFWNARHRWKSFGSWAESHC